VHQPTNRDAWCPGSGPQQQKVYVGEGDDTDDDTPSSNIYTYDPTMDTWACEEDTSINTGMEVNYCTTLCQRGIRVTEMGVGSTRC